MPELNSINTFDTFRDQTGGHQTIQGVRCMITNQSGHLFKYVEDTDRGKNEESFYKQVFSDDDFLTLKEFLPNYYGTININADENKLKYVELENLLHGFDYPNIMDLKIGKITYDPFATAEKVYKETTKYAAQKDIGFRLCGLKVYDALKGTYRNFNAREFRSCCCFKTPKERSMGYLQRFFDLCKFDRAEEKVNLPNSCEQCQYLRRTATENLLEHIIEDLEKLSQVLKTQKRLSFFSSSLLFAYDSKQMNAMSCCPNHLATHSTTREKVMEFQLSKNTSKARLSISIDVEHDCSPYVSNELEKNLRIYSSLPKSKSNYINCPPEDFRMTPHVPYIIRMIDFGHTYLDLFPGKKDENYLFGLHNLVKYFKTILKGL